MTYVTHDQVEALTLADRIVVLNDGVIQQVGSPLELYQTPANLFVAQFIGSPTMNILSVDVEGSQLILENGTHLSIAVEWSKAKKLGVRPENISLTDPSHESIVAAVEVVERLGSDSFVYVQADGVRRLPCAASITLIRP